MEICKRLKRIVIPEGVEELDWGIFAGCDNLEEVVLPESLKKIDEKSELILTASDKVWDAAETAFTEYKASEFPKYSPGELHLFHNIVIGKYPSYSSFIQRDFDTLLSGKGINHTLSDLVKEYKDAKVKGEVALVVAGANPKFIRAPDGAEKEEEKA